MKKYEDLVLKLEAAGDDEAAIEKVFTECYGEDITSEELSEADLEGVAGGFGEVEALRWLLKNTKLGKCTWKCTKVAAIVVVDMVVHKNPYRTYSKKQIQQYTKELEDATPGWMNKLASIGV